MGNSLIPSREFKIRSTTPNIKVEYFRDEEIEEMKKWIGFQGSRSYRTYQRFRWDDRAKYLLLLVFLLRTGGRISEVLELRVRDVDLEKNVIRIRTLKKKKETFRKIPVHPELRDAFQNYLYRVHPKPKDEMFPMSRVAVFEFFKRMEKDLGFEIYPHKFRHTFGVKAAFAGVPLNDLQGWLGHSSIWTTSIYTEATGRDTQEQMNRIK